MIEDFSPPDSPDDQNTNDPQQTDSDIPPQTSKESALQKSNTEVTRQNAATTSQTENESYCEAVEG